MGQTGLLDFAEFETRSRLELYVHQQLEQDDSNPVRALTFIADEDPASLFEDYSLKDYEVEVDRRDEFTLVNLDREITHSSYEDGYRIVDGSFYLLQHEEKKVYTAFAITEDDFYKNGMRPYISSLPGISTSYLNTDELRGFFDALDDSAHGQVLVSESVIKSPSKKTDILYPRGDPYHKIFNTKKVSDDDYYVDKVNFTINNSRTTFSGFVSRRGDTRFASGSTDIYFGHLLEILGRALLKKGSIFEDKSRDYGSREANRLEIQYEAGTMKGTEANMDLIGSLRDLNDSSVTVYHKNPYLHASLLDYKDGTSADVFITSDKTISIVPGFEATRKSLSRICEHINATFEEGEVTEGTSQDRDFDDFFGG